MSGESNSHEKIEWQISVPIFRNAVILKQLGIAVGIPFGLLTIILVLISDKGIYLLYALGIIGALLFLTWIFVIIVYRGKYEVEFVLDDKGVVCRTQAKQAKKNRIINTLTIVMGFLSGRPTVAGAGMLAQSRQEVFLKWNSVRKVRYRPRNRTIMIRGGWTENIALFCAEENYLLIEQTVKNKTNFPLQVE